MRFKSFVAGLLAFCLCFGALPALVNAGQAAMPYYITVDVTNQIVTVYENGNRTKGGVVRQMICSTGAPGHSTPLGTFTLPAKSRSSERTEWYSFPAYNCYAKWATRIRGGYLFHSILYKYRGGSPTSTSLRALGSRASHGCVRLRPDDAKWIALYCGTGTQVRIYNSGKWDSALRKKLLQRSFYRGRESYYSFLGLNTKIPLRKGSGGTLVKKLQKRLRALGFFTGSIGGNFLTLTDDAVRAFQESAGMKQNGVVTQKVWNRIFASDAPTGTRVPLAKGASGPAVAALQRALTAVKCYNGAINGKYDDATRKAVRKWQKARNFTVNGKASPKFQRKVLAAERTLRARYGDEPYKLVAVRKVTYQAKVNVSQAYVYKELNTSSAKLKTLKRGALVKLLAQGDGWVQVEADGVKGYMPESKLIRCDETVVSYVFMLASVPTPQTPVPLPAIEAVEPEAKSFAADLGWAVTMRDDVPARAFADENASALAGIPVNTVLCVLGMEDGFIRITWLGNDSWVALEDVTLVAEGEPMPEPVAPGEASEPGPEDPAAESEPEPEPETGSDPGAGLSLDDAENDVIDVPQAEDVSDGEIQAEAPQAAEAGEAEIIEVPEITEAPEIVGVPEIDDAETEADAPAAEEAEAFE